MLPVCEEQRDALRHVKLFVPVWLVSFWGHVLPVREHHSDALRDVELFVPVWLVSFWGHMHSDDDERPLCVAYVFSVVFHRHFGVGEVLVVSSKSEVLPERLDPLREFVHAHAHRCSHLHVLLPARENPQRLPLLHPHHNHYDYNHSHDDYDNHDYDNHDYDNHDHHDYHHNNCCDDFDYVGCVSCGEVPCEFFSWMCECACSFVGLFQFDF